MENTLLVLAMVIIIFGFIFTIQQVGFARKDVLQQIDFLRKDMEYFHRTTSEIKRDVYDIKYSKTDKG